MKAALKDLDDLVGRAISRVAEAQDMLILHFEDGEYAVLASGGDSECRYAPGMDELRKPYSHSEAEELFKAGVWSQEDLSRYAAEQKADEQRARLSAEARERAEYQRLKAKYGQS